MELLVSKIPSLWVDRPAMPSGMTLSVIKRSLLVPCLRSSQSAVTRDARSHSLLLIGQSLGIPLKCDLSCFGPGAGASLPLASESASPIGSSCFWAGADFSFVVLDSSASLEALACWLLLSLMVFFGYRGCVVSLANARLDLYLGTYSNDRQLFSRTKLPESLRLLGQPSTTPPEAQFGYYYFCNLAETL